MFICWESLPKACKIHFVRQKTPKTTQQRFLPSRKCSTAPSLCFHPFFPWRKATSQPHINCSTPAINLLWEAPFLLKQRLIVPHSLAWLQEMCSTILEWGFYLFMKFLHLWEKIWVRKCQKQILSTFSNWKLLMESRKSLFATASAKQGLRTNSLKSKNVFKLQWTWVKLNKTTSREWVQCRAASQTWKGPLQPCAPSTEQLQNTRVLPHLKSFCWIPSA